MGQVTIYLDDDLERKMVDAAKSCNLSKSKWIANLIQEKVAKDWPDAVIYLAGAWQDFPSIDDIRKNEGSDLPREKL